MSQIRKTQKAKNRTPGFRFGLKRFKPSRAQIVSGAMMFSAGMLAFAAAPNIFSSGTTISSAAVNENFAALEARIAALETKLASVSNETVNGQPTVRFTGVNVQVVNGAGSTGTANGTGNLIVGYDEADTSGVAHCTLGTNPNTNTAVTDATTCAAAGGSWTTAGFKTGSHYVVTGSQNNYSRWGGLLTGFRNTSNYDYTSVTGGLYNTASVSGGFGNTASGSVASVSGGNGNTASGGTASVSGGNGNTASGSIASVSGGYGCNTGAVLYKWIVGGLTAGCSATLGN